MKNGNHWPRTAYMASDTNFHQVSNMLIGLDFRLQADLVAVMRENPPDHEEICRLLRESKHECSDLHGIIDMIMLTENEVLCLWEKNKMEAANSGTWMHAMLEHHYNNHPIAAGCMRGELEAATSIVESIGILDAYRTEWCVYATDEDLAGSIDLVLRDPITKMLYLVDWKRSEKLQDKYQSFGKYMSPPLQNTCDCQGEHYRLQLNIYKWILEKYYDVQVAGMKVVCIHPRYLPDGFVDDVPNMQDAISALMQSRRDSIKAAKASRLPACPRLDDTQPFQVIIPSQASQEDIEDDIQKQLQIMLETDEHDVPEPAVKRRNFPGAKNHTLDFRRMLQRCDHIMESTLDVYTPDVCLKPNTILHNTKRLLSEIKSAYPFLSEGIARLILVAVHMTEGMAGDKPMLADSAALTWMIEGQRHMRVHKGFMYIYDDDGCFLPFNGIPPESVLQRVHQFFIHLEGIFRRMKPETSRKAEAIAKAIVADLQSFTNEQEFLISLREATNNKNKVPAYAGRLDAEEYGEDTEDRPGGGKESKSHELWTTTMAERAWKLSCTIRYELMQTRMISLLVEWCETEDMRSSCVCYNDICFLYDDPGSTLPVKAVKKGPENNCYIRIPHSLLDPVMQANKERLQLFYEHTFWCNLDVFRCFQSAIAIAKRGYNVDRCFIGISPGGVGQSLCPG